MAKVITGHLDHLEDLPFLYGFDGVEFGTEAVDDMVKTGTNRGGKSEVTEKVDGAPSMVFGSFNHKVFAAYKGRFDRKDQKVYYDVDEITSDPGNAESAIKNIVKDMKKSGATPEEIDAKTSELRERWAEGIPEDDLVGHLQATADILEVLKDNWPLQDGVMIQVDLLFSQSDPATITKQAVEFKPNVIHYSMPKKHPSFKSASRAKLGFAIHGVFRLQEQDGRLNVPEGGRANMSSMFTAADTLNKLEDIFAVCTTYRPEMYSKVEKSSGAWNKINKKNTEIKSLYSKIKTEIEFDRDFDDQWMSAKSSDAIGVFKKLVIQFVNKSVRELTSTDAVTLMRTSSENKFLKRFLSEYEQYMEGVIEKENPGDRAMKKYKDHNKFLEDSKALVEFFIRVFFKFYAIKKTVVQAFTKMDRLLGDTYLSYDKSNSLENPAKETQPEGHVQTYKGRLVKYVDREIFSAVNQVPEYKRFEECFVPSTKNIKSFQDLIEHEVMDLMNLTEGKITEAERLKGKGAAFIFGRFNPPTIGHKELLDEGLQAARDNNATLFSFASKSHGKSQRSPKKDKESGYYKDPLSYEDKIKYLREAFPKHNFVDESKLTKKLVTPYDILWYLGNEGYERIYFPVGDDRYSDPKDGFKAMVNKFMEKDGPELGVKSVELVNTGDRKPGVSATDMRNLAKEFHLAMIRGDKKDSKTYLEQFKGLLPPKIRDKAKEIAIKVSEGMGDGKQGKVVEDLDIKNLISERSGELSKKYGVAQDEVFDMMLNILGE